MDTIFLLHRTCRVATGDRVPEHDRGCVMSSGIRVTSRIEHRECGGTVTMQFPIFGDGPKFTQSWDCTFAGEVDVGIDPEDYTASWECPRCGAVHDVSREVFP